MGASLIVATLPGSVGPFLRVKQDVAYLIAAANAHPVGPRGHDRAGEHCRQDRTTGQSAQAIRKSQAGHDYLQPLAKRILQKFAACADCHRDCAARR